MLVYVDLAVAAYCLVFAPLTVLWALATPARRARAGAGGGLHPSYLLVLYVPLGVTFLLHAQNGWRPGIFSMLGLVPFLLVGRAHRRRIATLPAEELSPPMRRLREQEGPTMTIDPRIAFRRYRELRQNVWSREARLELKAWERERGLR